MSNHNPRKLAKGVGSIRSFQQVPETVRGSVTEVKAHNADLADPILNNLNSERQLMSESNETIGLGIDVSDQGPGLVPEKIESNKITPQESDEYDPITNVAAVSGTDGYISPPYDNSTTIPDLTQVPLGATWSADGTPAVTYPVGAPYDPDGNITLDTAGITSSTVTAPFEGESGCCQDDDHGKMIGVLEEILAELKTLNGKS